MPQYFSERGKNHLEVIERIKKKYGDRANIQFHKTIPAPGILGLFGKVHYEYRGFLRTDHETRVIQKTRDDESRTAILAANGMSVPISVPDVQTDDREEQIGEVLKEIRDLKGQLAISASTPPAEPYPVLSELAAIMNDNDFEQIYIDEILDLLRHNHSAAELENQEIVQHAAAILIAGSISYFQEDVSDGPRIFILVGPTGVGKTTTIAKLAAVNGLSRNGSDVRIITVDSFRIGARAQVETYGEIMGIPVSAVDNFDELRKQIALSSDADLILVDTIGKSPRDELKLEEMRVLLSACGENAEVHLALSATTKTADLRQILTRFETFKYRSVILTKLDETSRIGNLVSVLSNTEIPLSYLTDGQSVPVDIAVASPLRLLSRLKGLEYRLAELEEQFPAADLTAAWR
ncbi:MAG: flagellar biosynthesis protein FlhF [Spirochaetaceae bacterium]|nr:flagellar biosynthesis protein FlhF [Spirochaetaceae bacterium]